MEWAFFFFLVACLVWPSAPGLESPTFRTPVWGKVVIAVSLCLRAGSGRRHSAFSKPWKAVALRAVCVIAS